MDYTYSVDGLKTCPYCGARVPEKAIYCNECKTNLLAEFSGMKRELANPPSLGATLAAMAALLLLLFLTGITIFEVNKLYPYAGYIYIGVVTLALSFAAANGRYGTPAIGHYLLTLLIVIIPVVGTLYGVFYAARSLARARGARFALYFLLLGMAVVIFLHYDGVGIARARLPMVSDGSEMPAVEVAAQPTATLQPSATPSPKPEATATPQPTEVVQELAAAVTDCLHWSEVSSEMVGQELCVYGEFETIFQKEDQTYVMSFSEQEGAFQIWSWPKPMEDYLPEGDERCIMARNWLKTSGVRPIIILRRVDTLESCEG
jgi:hypothetical protein